MRLVLDTNVLISAILSPNSISAKILNWGEDNGVILYSAATLNEVLSVLGRSKFSKYIDHDDIDGLSIRIKTVWLFVEILNQVQLCRDPKDDKFIDLALNGKASHLITGDSDLLVLNPVENTSIINPRTFWDEIIKL
ncbi:MAG: putative toxin-antitoxin system toxin component, PIN family [Pseudanabaena sp.]|jgi:putative PIN family toxin of toxin-antitoxin system|nr:putative toxin-antitoxin system toxin component, PIN family [Pseudanabaena sp. M090S1SP2A07QC]MCA6507847.1 putative toxin-antitoxin system toxin component, PIN family [Pseudanabaena sp. M172S2SP2A07QC]MCA6522507.1 putative toxin-antitoxin system toxin component, PIN family [Pseudanabaena sp. M051S1SP2A07QC]MCA6528148.1 putative toxin-antitoxin system toxin component, PIN family [Pseudanabaena sp. M179S2SP2A07QC]MCA6532411.1 putative toxin-antitoxin system toxin component, PIN family [Pseudan